MAARVGGPIYFDFEDTNHEAHFPAEQPRACPPSRLLRPQGNRRRPQGPSRPPQARPQEPLRIISLRSPLRASVLAWRVTSGSRLGLAFCFCPSGAGREPSGSLGFRPTGRRMVMRWRCLWHRNHSRPSSSHLNTVSPETARAPARPQGPRSEAKPNGGISPEDARADARAHTKESQISRTVPIYLTQ